MRKKKSLTLLECVIAFVLTAALLSVLFGSYRQNAGANAAAMAAKKAVLARQHVQQRLFQLFQTASLPEKEEKKSLPLFHTAPYPHAAGPALHFAFDNGVDADPSFCQKISAILYLDPQENLCLDTLSSKQEKRRELLLEKVSSVRFFLFDASCNEWKTHWEKNKEELPAIIKLSIKERAHPNRDLEFAFLLSEADQKITYTKKGL